MSTWKRIDEKEFQHWGSIVLRNEGNVCRDDNTTVYSIGEKELLKKRECLYKNIYLKNCEFIGEME